MASSPARVVGEQAPVALLAGLPAHLTDSLVTDLQDGDAAATSSLVAALAAVPDVRRRRGRRHELTGVLAIAACACLTGATSYVAISEWAAAQGRAVLGCLDEEPCRRALPCEATLRRCLQATDAAAVDAAVAGWAGERLAARQAAAAHATGQILPPDPARRRVIALDGKTLRGSAPRSTPEQVALARSGGGRTHLVAACDHASGVTLGQVACSPEAGQGGEVAAAKTLAAALDERDLLAESVITSDAGFTARDLAAELRCRGAHWILRIKGNPKTLHAGSRRCPGRRCPRPPGCARSGTAGSRPAPSG
jgi:DDE_Tnp_1-associated/Transposase DDE domain